MDITLLLQVAKYSDFTLRRVFYPFRATPLENYALFNISVKGFPKKRRISNLTVVTSVGDTEVVRCKL
jgi:hypothetical protein